MEETRASVQLSEELRAIFERIDKESEERCARLDEIKKRCQERLAILEEVKVAREERPAPVESMKEQFDAMTKHFDAAMERLERLQERVAITLKDIEALLGRRGAWADGASYVQPETSGVRVPEGGDSSWCIIRRC